MTADPATSAAPARAADTSLARARRHDLDELDDDDLVEIGRVVEGRTPRRLLRALGVVGGTAAGLGIAAIAPAALPLIVAVTLVGTIAAFAFTHGDAVVDLKDAGLADDLAVALGAAAAAEERRVRREKITVLITGAQQRAHLKKVGARVVEAARQARQPR